MKVTVRVVKLLLTTFPCNLLLAATAYAAAEMALLTVFLFTGRPGLLQAANWGTRALYAALVASAAIFAWRTWRSRGR